MIKGFISCAGMWGDSDSESLKQPNANRHNQIFGFPPCSSAESTERGALTLLFSLRSARERKMPQNSGSWEKKAFPLKITKLVLYNAARCLDGPSRHSAMKPSSD